MHPLLRKLFGRSQPPKPPETSEEVTRVFLELFRAHGLEASLADGWIVAESVGLAAQARVFSRALRHEVFSAQLDFDVRATALAGRNILESCGGFGISVGLAVGDAIRNLCEGSFHVIFSALTGQACSHCEVEDWVVDGRPRKLFIGPIVGRGPETPRADWFAAMELAIGGTAMPPGFHWLRLYHAEIPGGEPTSEALLDNEHCPTLQMALGSLEWPRSENFASVRLFMIITDA
jgi:hypothetical protein